MFIAANLYLIIFFSILLKISAIFDYYLITKLIPESLSTIQQLFNKLKFATTKNHQKISLITFASLSSPTPFYRVLYLKMIVFFNKFFPVPKALLLTPQTHSGVHKRHDILRAQRVFLISIA